MVLRCQHENSCIVPKVSENREGTAQYQRVSRKEEKPTNGLNGPSWDCVMKNTWTRSGGGNNELEWQEYHGKVVKQRCWE